jgi:hypothetical protein
MKDFDEVFLFKHSLSKLKSEIINSIKIKAKQNFLETKEILNEIVKIIEQLKSKKKDISNLENPFSKMTKSSNSNKNKLNPFASRLDSFETKTQKPMFMKPTKTNSKLLDNIKNSSVGASSKTNLDKFKEKAEKNRFNYVKEQQDEQVSDRFSLQMTETDEIEKENEQIREVNSSMEKV